MTSLRHIAFGPLLAILLCLPNGCATKGGARKEPSASGTPLSTPSGKAVPERTDLPPTITPAEPAPVIATPAPTNTTPSPSQPVASAPRTNRAPVKPAPAAVKPAAAAPKTAPAKPAAVTKYVNASDLNVRAAASPDARVVDQIDRGTKVSVKAEAKGKDGQSWSQIEYRESGGVQTGWVSTNYLASSYTSVPREPAPRVGTSAAPDKPADFGDFANLHYAPVPKPSYEGNPRVDARALYISLNVLSSSRFDDLLKLLDETELNALVIDYKDDVGWLITKSATAARLVPAANEKAKYNDISDLVKKLKAKNIYLIARIVTFKDPMFAKAHPEKAIMNRGTGKVFQSEDGLSWASPHDRDFRDYNLGIAKEAATAGFNEVQFDYIRFPDVPRTMDLDYRNPGGISKAQAIQSFLLEARRELAPLKVYVAADVFGLVTVTKDDMRIGQFWEAVSNAVDYICPMIYPSHYANNSYGLAVPDQFPYELIDRSLRDALKRNRAMETPAQIRPWLQSFTASWVKGHITYTPAQIKAQIKAAANNGVRSYLMWHPSGKYNAAGYK